MIVPVFPFSQNDLQVRNQSIGWTRSDQIKVESEKDSDCSSPLS